MENKNDICPLCGQPNDCQFVKGMPHGNCWCEQTKVPKELREQIPDEFKGKACICQACIKKYYEN